MLTQSARWPCRQVGGQATRVQDRHQPVAVANLHAWESRRRLRSVQAVRADCLCLCLHPGFDGAREMIDSSIGSPGAGLAPGSEAANQTMNRPIVAPTVPRWAWGVLAIFCAMQMLDSVANWLLA